MPEPAILDIDGTEYHIPPTAKAIRLRAADGTLLFTLDPVTGAVVSAGTVTAAGIVNSSTSTATTVTGTTAVKTPLLDGVAPTGAGLTIGVGASSKVGFYGHAVVALQTGVAVDAAGIHAALVALGLITA